MKKSLLLGTRRLLLRIPRPIWQREVERSASAAKRSLAFMSSAHHRIRDFVVREMPRIGEPISPQIITESLEMEIDQVVSILDELERNLTFLFRNEYGAVTWAYPVTVDRTPHRIVFNTGEQIYAAWAVDAIAMPFVQGQLRKEDISFTIHTQCTHSGKEIDIEIDSQLNYKVLTPKAKPLVFIPMVAFKKLKDPSIIDAFWRNSVFFWSEEQARGYRDQHANIRGSSMTLEQACFLTPKVQGWIFGFPRWWCLRMLTIP